MDPTNTPNETPSSSSGAATPLGMPANRRVALALLLAGAFSAGMGQTIVFSVLPPLARDVGLSDRAVVAIFMISAFFWVICGPRWGRLSDRYGRKPFVLLGLVGFVVSTFAFATTLSFATAGAISGAALSFMLIATRAIYGLIGSAGLPAAQAYIADRTVARDRTAGIASFAAAFGFGAMLGPGFGALFSVFGKIAPFFAIATLAVIMLIASFVGLPEQTPPRARSANIKVSLFDRRIRAFLVMAVGFSFGHAVMIQMISFYFMDVLAIGPDLAPQIAGVGLMASSMAALFAQLVIVQRFRVEPSLLIRIGPALTAFGYFLIWATPFVGPVIFGMTIAGFGIGLAFPGCNAAVSLRVRPEEQGHAMGLASSCGASGFIVAPIFSLSLYAYSPSAVFIMSMALSIALLIFAMRSRDIINASAAQVDEALAASEVETASSAYR